MRSLQRQRPPGPHTSSTTFDSPTPAVLDRTRVKDVPMLCLVVDYSRTDWLAALLSPFELM